MPSIKIRRKKHVDLEKLAKKLNVAPKVKVGFVAGQSDPTEIQKAVFNEFGTNGGGWGGPIPERPFMRNAIKDNKSDYRQTMKDNAKKLLRGDEDAKAVLRKLGVQAERDIRGEIDSLSTPPNSPVTVERKGSNNPLMDTGAMRKGVLWDIEE